MKCYVEIETVKEDGSSVILRIHNGDAEREANLSAELWCKENLHSWFCAFFADHVGWRGQNDYYEPVTVRAKSYGTHAQVSEGIFILLGVAHEQKKTQR